MKIDKKKKNIQEKIRKDNMIKQKKRSRKKRLEKIGKHNTVII